MRKTFGWHRKKERISISYLEKLSGSTASSVLNSINSLIEKGIIKKEVSGDFGKEETFYELVVDYDSNNSDHSSEKSPPHSFDKSPPTLPKRVIKESLNKQQQQQEKKDAAAVVEKIPSINPDELEKIEDLRKLLIGEGYCAPTEFDKFDKKFFSKSIKKYGITAVFQQIFDFFTKKTIYQRLSIINPPGFILTTLMESYEPLNA